MKLKKGYLALTIAATLGLTAYDSGSNNSTSGAPSSFKITAIDGYLANAEVWGGEDCAEKLASTDENGKADIAIKYQAHPICIIAVAGKTIDLTRDPVEHEFELSAPAGYDVVSPITDLVAEQMEADSTLTQEQAEQKVIKAVSAGTTVSKNILFGDYVAENSTEADTIELVAETLVDVEGRNLSVAQKLSVTEELYEDIAEKVESNNGKLPGDYAPEVIIGDGGTVEVAKNHKPTTAEEFAGIEPQQYEMVDGSVSLAPLDIPGMFVDADSDELTYAVKAFDTNGKPVENASGNSISINDNNKIVSTFTQAGTYTVYVFADDGKVRSEPVTYTIDITTPNVAPEIDSDTQNVIRAELAKLEIHANENIEETISIANLFTDSDELTYTVKHSTNTTITISDKTLNITGAFNGEDIGTQEITISANDGVNENVSATFTLEVLEAIIPNTAPQVNPTLATGLQNDINAWVLTEGEQPQYTLDISPLFTDADNDKLTYRAGSTLTVNGQSETGFQVNVSENGIVSFNGPLPRAAANAGDEHLYVYATDGVNNEVSKSFDLPRIEAADEQPAPENTLSNFLFGDDQTEFFASMNTRRFEHDGGVQSFNGDGSNSDIDGNKFNGDGGTDTFMYVGEQNKVALAVASDGDIIIWSHDDLNTSKLDITDTLLTGTWYLVMDDAGTSEGAPDMMYTKLDFDKKLWSDEEASNAFSSTINGSQLILDYSELNDQSEEEVFTETFTLKSQETTSGNEVLVFKAQWTHDSGSTRTGYKVMVRSKEFADTLLNPANIVK